MAGLAVVGGRRASGASLECALRFVAGGVAAAFEIINGVDGRMASQSSGTSSGERARDGRQTSDTTDVRQRLDG